MVSSSRILAGCLLVAVAVAAGAQTVVVRPTPRPDHKTSVTTTQELSLAATGVPGSVSGKVVIDSKGALTFTRTNGHFDDRGLMEAQLTIDRFEMTQAINGKADSARDTSAAVGHSVTAVFDRTGHLADVTVPPELKQLSATVRQLLNGIYGLVDGLPEGPMNIGDSATAPGNIPLFLPGTSAAAPAQTRTIVTLRRVEAGKNGRIAYLDQRIESDGLGDQFTVNGKGTIEVNLDQGFVTSSVMNWTLAGSLRAAGGAGLAPPPSAQVQATFTMTLTATEAS
jgi:hypothetical protein